MQKVSILLQSNSKAHHKMSVCLMLLVNQSPASNSINLTANLKHFRTTPTQVAITCFKGRNHYSQTNSNNPTTQVQCSLVTKHVFAAGKHTKPPILILQKLQSGSSKRHWRPGQGSQRQPNKFIPHHPIQCFHLVSPGTLLHHFLK